jgi:hypothetical protein
MNGSAHTVNKSSMLCFSEPPKSIEESDGHCENYQIHN